MDCYAPSNRQCVSGFTHCPGSYDTCARAIAEYAEVPPKTNCISIWAWFYGKTTILGGNDILECGEPRNWQDAKLGDHYDANCPQAGEPVCRIATASYVDPTIPGGIPSFGLCGRIGTGNDCTYWEDINEGTKYDSAMWFRSCPAPRGRRDITGGQYVINGKSTVCSHSGVPEKILFSAQYGVLAVVSDDDTEVSIGPFPGTNADKPCETLAAQTATVSLKWSTEWTTKHIGLAKNGATLIVVATHGGQNLLALTTLDIQRDASKHVKSAAVATHNTFNERLCGRVAEMGSKGRVVAYERRLTAGGPCQHVLRSLETNEECSIKPNVQIGKYKLSADTMHVYSILDTTAASFLLAESPKDLVTIPLYNTIFVQNDMSPCPFMQDDPNVIVVAPFVRPPPRT